MLDRYKNRPNQGKAMAFTLAEVLIVKRERGKMSLFNLSRTRELKEPSSRFIKQCAFTLAEVLITLGIIGIVAAMTIPTLMNNMNDQQLKVAWKKAYSEFSNATNLIIMDNGGSLTGAFSGDLLGSESLKNAYVSKLGVIKTCSGIAAAGGTGSGASADGCWHSGGWLNLNGTARGDETNPGFILKNGNLVHMWINKTDCTSVLGDYQRCGGFSVDVNGFKKPNTWGKDIFSVSITSNGLIPYGAKGFGDPDVTCVEGSTDVSNLGNGCAAKYLYK